MPKVGETWQVQILRRVYWSSEIVQIIQDNGKEFGWIIKYHTMNNTFCVAHNQIKFKERIIK